MHRHARPRTYLEIGVHQGESLREAARSTRVVGVDPFPQVAEQLPPRWTVYADTSDAFFAAPGRAAAVGPIDVAFIDGLHVFEQALRDFIHLEPLMSPNGVVLLHDCLPPDPSWAGRTANADVPGWAGDVWKVVPILAAYRPDLRVDIVAARPTGLGVITRLDATSQALTEQFDAIVSEWLDAEYAPGPATLGGAWDAASHLFPTFRRPNVLDEIEHNGRRARYLTRKYRRRVGRTRSN